MARSFLSFADLSKKEAEGILGRTSVVKRRIKARERMGSLEGRVVGLLFEKPSTRTRVGFEVAALRLGAHTLYLPYSELQLARGEPLKDTARVLGSYLDAIVARVFAHETLLELSRRSGIPVINGLSDLEHPAQALSDLFTILEKKKRLRGLKLAYVGDGNNVCNSLLLACATFGLNMSVACPKGYEPDKAILEKALKIAGQNGSRVEVLRDPRRAAREADVLYTDVWVSMGEEKEEKERIAAFRGYAIDGDLLRTAKRGALVMHCLPARRGLEITDVVIEGRNSCVWEQAENRLYGAAALLEFFLRV